MWQNLKLQYFKKMQKNNISPLNLYNFKTKCSENAQKDLGKLFFTQNHPHCQNNQCCIGFSQATNSCSRGLFPVQSDQKQPQFISLIQSFQEFDLNSSLEPSSNRQSEDLRKHWKSLVPKELSTNLSQSYQLLMKVAALIDGRLYLMKRCGFRQSFQNLKIILRQKIDHELEITQIKQINYLIPGYYQFCQDPLGNIALGLCKEKGTKTQRKRKLRFEFYRFASKLKNNFAIEQIDQQIPQEKIQLTKIQAFFPQTLKQKKQFQLIDSTFQFLQKSKNQLKERQSKMFDQKILKQDTKILFLSDFEIFSVQIIRLFEHHEVSNMYKVDIISWFQRHGRSSNQTLKLLNFLLSTQVFLRAYDRDSLTIIQLQVSEKKRALQIIENVLKNQLQVEK